MNYRLTLISAILIVCALCSTRSFAEVVEIKGYHYDINKEEKVATLMRYTGTSTSVEIPTSIKYNDIEYVVTEINYRVFRYSKMRNLIKKITITLFILKLLLKMIMAIHAKLKWRLRIQINQLKQYIHLSMEDILHMMELTLLVGKLPLQILLIKWQ